MPKSYNIIHHEFDVVVVGAGGAGFPTLWIRSLSIGVTVLGGHVSVIPQPFKKRAFGQYL